MLERLRLAGLGAVIHFTSSLICFHQLRAKVRAYSHPHVPISQMSPLCLREAAVELTHDLIGSKGLGADSGTQVLEVNTQGKFCCPTATSCGIHTQASPGLTVFSGDQVS